MMRTQYPNKAPQPMPGNVKGALAKRKLLDTFLERPQYQQDDYLKWIALAAGPQQKQQRLDQMLDEVEKGNVFKGEPWTAPAKTEPAKATPTESKPSAAKSDAAKSDATKAAGGKAAAGKAAPAKVSAKADGAKPAKSAKK